MVVKLLYSRRVLVGTPSTDWCWDSVATRIPHTKKIGAVLKKGSDVFSICKCVVKICKFLAGGAVARAWGVRARRAQVGEEDEGKGAIGLA